eukprot:scaffold2.g7470.t1
MDFLNKLCASVMEAFGYEPSDPAARDLAGGADTPVASSSPMAGGTCSCKQQRTGFFDASCECCIGEVAGGGGGPQHGGGSAVLSRNTRESVAASCCSRAVIACLSRASHRAPARSVATLSTQAAMQEAQAHNFKAEEPEFAGIAGLSCAYNLVKEGKRVVVLESRVIGGGMTGRSTAHIMNWLDDYYYECISMHGLEKSKLVAESLGKAADWIEAVTREEGIECKFRRVDGFLYPHATGESPMPTSATSALRKELEACHKLGMTNVEMVDLGGGPEVGGIHEALRFPNNADFHPLMYLDGLAKAVERRGGRIYERTKYWTAEGGTVLIEGSDATVRCNAVVLATCSPINHNLAVHARQLPYRTYAVGMLIRKDQFRLADYWDTAEPYHYVRADDWDEEHYLLIVGGEDHKTGSLWPYNPYERLEKYARSRWTAVMEPADMLYLHGKNPLDPDGHNYIITGDSGQGMTGGTIGGILVSDLILGRGNPWADGLHKVAVYCDKYGKQRAFSAVCPHMGCLLHFNSLEKTFDCPCHGSNFDRYGRVIQGGRRGATGGAGVKGP